MSGIVQFTKTWLTSLLQPTTTLTTSVVPKTYLSTITSLFTAMYSGGITTETGRTLLTENGSYLVWE